MSQHRVNRHLKCFVIPIHCLFFNIIIVVIFIFYFFSSVGVGGECFLILSYSFVCASDSRTEVLLSARHLFNRVKCAGPGSGQRSSSLRREHREGGSFALGVQSEP